MSRVETVVDRIDPNINFEQLLPFSPSCISEQFKMVIKIYSPGTLTVEGLDRPDLLIDNRYYNEALRDREVVNTLVSRGRLTTNYLRDMLTPIFGMGEEEGLSTFKVHHTRSEREFPGKFTPEVRNDIFIFHIRRCISKSRINEIYLSIITVLYEYFEAREVSISIKSELQRLIAARLKLQENREFRNQISQLDKEVFTRKETEKLNTISVMCEQHFEWAIDRVNRRDPDLKNLKHLY